MDENISSINRLLGELSYIKEYSSSTSIDLQVIYDELYIIISDLHNKDRNKWQEVLDGVLYIRNFHFAIIKGKKSSKRLKRESFWKAHEQISDDLNEIKKRFTGYQ